MKIIAFDLGTTWANASNRSATPGRHFFLTGKHRAAKLAAFKRQLHEIIWQQYDLVVYERPFARGQAATRMLWGMAGLLEADAAPYCAIQDVTPSEIKKWATGSGKADKGKVEADGLPTPGSMLEAAARMGYGGDNEHEADAFCLLRYAEATMTGTPS